MIKYQLTARTVARLLGVCDREGRRYAEWLVHDLNIPGADFEDLYQVAADRLWIKPPSLTALFLRYPRKRVHELLVIKLKRLIRDEARLYLRHKDRKPELKVECEPGDGGRDARCNDIGLDIGAAIETLSARERIVFTARTVNGLSWDEAAEAFGVTAHDRVVIFPRAVEKVRSVLRAYA
jgi:DNA-directed RNA polymerase specialized sigma24 family protein